MMAKVVVAIDLGGTNIKAALVATNGQILREKRVPTEAAEGPEAVCSRIVVLARDLIQAEGLAMEDVISVGIGVPGPLNSKTGVVLRCPNMPGWEDFKVAEFITEQLQVAVHIENDANAAALAEAWVGAGKGTRHVVCMTLGTGVGCGVVANGRILKGQGQGAELGHMIVREGGRLCGCGARGCLEAYAAAGSVAKRAIDALNDGGPAVRKSRLAGTTPTCKSVFQAAEEGDALALRLVSDTARYLAAGLASVVHIFHPQVIVLTGGMISAGDDAVLGPTKKFLSTLAMSEMLQSVEIKLSPLEDRAGVLGAAAIALNRSGHPVLDLEEC